MNTTELLTDLRTELSDSVAPYLWSDASLYKYIDDAQKQFCRLTYGIEDARSFKLKVVPDTEWYAYDPLILKVRSVVDAATGRDVPLIPVEKMAPLGIRFDGTKAPIRNLITGLEKGSFRAHPMPSVAATLELRTFRLPNAVGAGDDFEIDEQHHTFLMLWCKHRAYDVQDADTIDVRKSVDYKDRFERYCAASKTEQSRLMRPAGTVIYGDV
jgi:hypothetical protein